MTFACINIDGLKAARTGRDPFNFLVGENFIQPPAVEPLKKDFPDLKEPGFLTETDIGAGIHGAFQKLLADLKSPEVSKIVSETVSYTHLTLPTIYSV